MKIHSINFDVKWHRFKLYSSFFIPCLDWRRAKEIIQDECDKRHMTVIIRLSIEEGIRGVRVWRVPEEKPAPKKRGRPRKVIADQPPSEQPEAPSPESS